MFISNPTHFLISAKPMRPVPITAIVLPVTSSPKNGRYGCQAPQRLSRTNSIAGPMSQVAKTRKRGSFDKTCRSTKTEVRLTKYEVATHKQSKLGATSYFGNRTSYFNFGLTSRRSITDGASARCQFPL